MNITAFFKNWGTGSEESGLVQSEMAKGVVVAF